MKSSGIEQRSRRWMIPQATIAAYALAGLIVWTTGCGSDSPITPPVSPTPLPDTVTANVYILAGAVQLGRDAFGDHPVVIYRGERMRWRNADSVEHSIVSDTPSLPEFTTTGTLAPGGERSFAMNTVGTTPIHCTVHPQMVGTLIVQER
jgi:plastocyanin